jgi:hypothetical protein
MTAARGLDLQQVYRQELQMSFRIDSGSRGCAWLPRTNYHLLEKRETDAYEYSKDRSMTSKHRSNLGLLLLLCDLSRSQSFPFTCFDLRCLVRPVGQQIFDGLKMSTFRCEM